MVKKEPERQGLKTDPKRQADDKLRGYVYQIWHSVDAWLDLTDSEVLYLEGAEDFDRVSDDTAMAVQVKDTQRNITLRSQGVTDAINHYWELRNHHLDLSVKFRFLTRSKIGKEKDSPFGENQTGLELWSHCSGDETVIKEISKFLQDEENISKTLDDFLQKASPQEIYEKLIEPITWDTECEEASYVEKSIENRLISHGAKQGISPSDSRKVVSRLLKEALTVATQQQNRELTQRHFLEMFEEETTQRVPSQYLKTLQMQSTMVDSVSSLLTGEPANIVIQSQSSVQTDIPPLYPDVAPRIDIVTSIQKKLLSEGLVVIQGGTGMGKTTLAKLTANAINGSWFWLNFTKRDSSQVAQFLQQLAIEINNQSSQINIILDDLNLEPKHLRQYEEILGAVIYSTLKHDAKLLITSQHKLPNNIIRRLGISESKSVILTVPDFTISEIEQFARQLGCPANQIETWAKLIRLHTKGHPRLVHARLAHLRIKDWKEKEESILTTPSEIIEEREEARQLLADLPEDQREFLYRLSLMFTPFTREYALNIGEISESIPLSGDIFSQLVGPWIDPARKEYYTISPLLDNAAKQVWSEDKINTLHAQIANAILKTKNITTTEAWAVLSHSILGQNKEGLVAIVRALLTVPKEDWKKLSQEFSWLIHVKIDPPEELFPGDSLVNHLFRSLQYSIAVETKPEFAPKILGIWDKEIKPYEPHKSYILSRIMLATQALIYYQVPLPVNKTVGYLKELIEIKDSDKETQEIYDSFIGQLKEYRSEKSNFFSILFKFTFARRPFYAPNLNDLVDVLDEIQPEIRAILLVDFDNDSIYPQLLIDSVWIAEADLENSDWKRCLQLYDKVIEKTIAWGYPHLAAAAARGKAIIHDEYLQDPDTAHEVLQDIILKMGSSTLIEEAQAVIYSNNKYYRDALKIYERILPKWNPSLELELNFVFLERYRRAGICAAYLDDWEKAATFFEEGAKRSLDVGNAKKYIGFYADVGFAQFKSGNLLSSIKLLKLALQELEKVPQDNTNVIYFTLKKRLGHTIAWLAAQQMKNKTSIEKDMEPLPGWCSDPETKEKVLNIPDYPIGYSWLCLAQIEYKFELDTTAFQHAWNTADRDAYPALNFFLLSLKTQYDLRNKTFDDFPHRIYQLADAHASFQKHSQNKKGIGEKGVYFTSIDDLSNFSSIDDIIDILVAALLIQLPEDININKTLVTWRTNSLELPIKENMIVVLDLIEPILSKDKREASKIMGSQEFKQAERLAAALKTIHNTDTDPTTLFCAHTLVATAIIDNNKYRLWGWEEHIMISLSDLFSIQWLEKIKFRAMLNMTKITVPDIENACNSSETGKKKIGQILLAASQAVSITVPPDILQNFRNWIEDVA